MEKYKGRLRKSLLLCCKNLSGMSNQYYSNLSYRQFQDGTACRTYKFPVYVLYRLWKVWLQAS